MPKPFGKCVQQYTVRRDRTVAVETTDFDWLMRQTRRPTKCITHSVGLPAATAIIFTTCALIDAVMCRQKTTAAPKIRDGK